MERVAYRIARRLSASSHTNIFHPKSIYPVAGSCNKPHLTRNHHSTIRPQLHESEGPPRVSHPATMVTPKPLTGDPKQYPPNHFSKSITGTCLCGSVNVTINEDIFAAPSTYICHCSNCRKVSGSYAAPNLRIAKEKVEILDRQGSLKVYEDWETGSGNVVKRTFCSGCGS
jgi:hypothetical protein